MIKKFLSNAVLSLVMDKQAKEKLKSMRQVRKIANGGEAGMVTDPPAQASVDKPGPDRQELIAQAMAIHQTKAAIFDDLTLNEKRQLRELAAKALLGNGRQHEEE